MPSKKKTTKKRSVSTKSVSRSVAAAPRSSKSWRSMNMLGGIVVILLGITVVLLMITYFSVQPQP